MADRMRRNRTQWALLLALPWAMTSVASAQESAANLPDPTRPPAAMLSPAAAEGETTGPVLQSVLIPKKGSPVAIIGGQQVRLGGMYGEQRLTRLTEREAVLEGPSGVERLLLTPDAVKTNIVTPKTRKTTAPRSAQRGNTQ
jgi:hypothetical protein